ncbi:MAG: UDP-N-acetyl glucosamine 2-epimerase [Paludibacteraceae bacterium]|nr:UDP-N-acetyl glucosamine 2-epimerase [Paludibacteraceae bacterium]
MKVAPIIKAIKAHNEGLQVTGDGLRDEKISYRLVHTGQHYDKNMSDTFFEELGIPAPDVNLGCGGGTQAEQTAAIMVAFEKELMAHPADIVMVVGDVTSTMACSIVAKKLNTKVCHVEAGIRSWDLTMPEEINRMVTDSLADYMFTTSDVANRNLVRQGAVLMENKNIKNTACAAININKEEIKNNSQKVWFVGNVMIDTLLANRSRFRKPEVWDELGLKEQEFIVMTMHRPANVDEENHLRAMIEQIIDNVHGLPVIFPIHPRTALRLRELLNERSQTSSMSAIESLNDANKWANLNIVEPMGYLEFNYLVERAKAVVTDSGGITEETTVMGVPCITLRDNTERPETCTVGTNELIGTDPAAIKPALDKLFAGEWKKGAIPELWDGHTAARIIEILADL